MEYTLEITWVVIRRGRMLTHISLAPKLKVFPSYSVEFMYFCGQTIVGLFRLRVYWIPQTAIIQSWENVGKSKTRTKNQNQNIKVGLPLRERNLARWRAGRWKDCIPPTLTWLGLSYCTSLGLGLGDLCENSMACHLLALWPDSSVPQFLQPTSNGCWEDYLSL